MNQDSIGCLFYAAVLGFIVWLVVRDTDWATKMCASTHYSIRVNQVEIASKRPHDCDFMSAPLGSKHCSYERIYEAEWIIQSTDNPPKPISYGSLQAEPPTSCSQATLDFSHRCYYIELKPGETVSGQWHARKVSITWKKVDE
jgi:hypothetical protein